MKVLLLSICAKYLQLTLQKMSKKQNNCLLTKTELGEVKKGFHQLPPDSHTYGKAPQKDKEGAREVISKWDEGSGSKSKQGGKNFISMNRDGLKKGFLNSKDIAEYRKNNQIKVKVKQGQKFYGVNIPDQQFTYGIPNRPSTPIKNVICNTYAEEQLKLREEREAVLRVIEKDDKKISKVEVEVKGKKPQDRRKEIEHNNFKLSKFKNIESKVKPMMKAHN